MLLDSIRTQLDTLSKSERKVAQAVLRNPQRAIAENITALARNAHVSEPTVVRFCRAIGYHGWREFKMKLAQGLALKLGPELREKMQDAQQALSKINMQFDSFLRQPPKS